MYTSCRIQREVLLMKTAVFLKEKTIEIQNFEDPHVEDDKILVKVDACGICTWEQRIYSGNVQTTFPFIGGHEVSGHIVAIGNHVQGTWKVNQNVVVGATLPCRECYFCKLHEEQSCIHFDSPKQLPAQPYSGTGGFSEYMLVSPQCVFPYEGVRAEEACLCEPLSCVVHSVEKMNPQFGDIVVIVGAGIMGLLHMQLCSKRGCYVIIVDINQERLRIAKSMGAHVALNPKKEDVEQRIQTITHGNKAQAVFDTLSIASQIETCYNYIGNTGKLMIYSGMYPNHKISLDAHWLHKKSIQIMGTANSNDRDFMRSIALISLGIIDMKPFISNIFPIERVQDALESSCKGNTFRNIVVFNAKEGPCTC